MDGKKFSGAFLTAALMIMGMSATAAHAMTAKECYKSFRAERKAGDLKGWNIRISKRRVAVTQLPRRHHPPLRKQRCRPRRQRLLLCRHWRLPRRRRRSARRQPLRGVPFSRRQWRRSMPISNPVARVMQTCLDQYKANKASNGNGGLRWIQKGGGYYSECNKRLKQ